MAIQTWWGFIKGFASTIRLFLALKPGFPKGLRFAPALVDALLNALFKTLFKTLLNALFKTLFKTFFQAHFLSFFQVPLAAALPYPFSENHVAHLGSTTR
jgi:hypothetical protein